MKTYEKIMNNWEHYKREYTKMNNEMKRSLKDDIYALPITETFCNRLWEVLNSDIKGNSGKVRNYE